ncbi:MAG: hypothetical protein PHD15_05390 [Clostridia bacterium]|nr:hypothetical protein [Clostridia bacterium]MDD4387168.1 hypothetical protein [Clostridia bacterium]
MLKYKLIGYRDDCLDQHKKLEKIYIDNIYIDDNILWNKFVKENNISKNCPKKIIPLLDKYKYTDFLEDINKERTIVFTKNNNKKKYFYTITQYKNFVNLIIMGTDAYYKEKEYLSINDFLSDKIIDGETIINSWDSLKLNIGIIS